MNYNHLALPFSDFIFTIAIIFIVFFLTFKNTSVKNKSTVIEKDTTNLLKGFFILTVVLHHLSQRLIDPQLLKLVYGQAGYVSVGMFFFLSGYGLSISSKKSSDTFTTFVKKKLTRVYLPCVVINLIVFSTLNVNANLFEIMIPTSVDSTQWFISVILIFYSVQYVSNKVNINNIIFITLSMFIYMIGCYLMKLGEWWYVSSLCFPLGFAWHKYNKNISNVLSKLNVIQLSIIIFVLISLLIIKKFFTMLAIVACPAFCLLVLLSIYKFEIKSKTISLIGMCSLEIYIIHMKLMWVLEYFLSNNNFNYSGSIWLIPYFMILILSAYVFYRVNNYFLKLIN